MTAVDTVPGSDAAPINETVPSLAEVAALVGGQRGKVRRVAIAAGLVGLFVGAGGAVAASYVGAEDDATERATVDLVTVAAESRDVTVYTEYAGNLGYGSAVEVVTRGAGTLTAVPSLGTDLTRGAIAFETDEEPVVLLYGDLPLWRVLEEGVDDGPDVLQLELNLAALGYGSGVTIDQTFTSATEDALEALEAALGQSDPDGVLDQGEAVFTSGPIRVDDVLTRGTSVSAGTSILTGALLEDVTDTVAADGTAATASAPTQSVTYTIASSEQGGFAVGDAVVVEMADGALVAGEVSAVSDTPRRDGTGPGANLVLDVTVGVTEVPEAGLIEGPANVRITDEHRAGVTMVPVRALVALAEGGFAVQVVDDAGVESYVGVETGVFQDGWVEVTGDVAPGDLVKVPQ